MSSKILQSSMTDSLDEGIKGTIVRILIKRVLIVSLSYAMFHLFFEFHMYQVVND